MNILYRNSSFELLRLIAQFMIVVYHILLFWFINNGASATPEVYKTICIPLHIGVLLYVYISGYFGIHFSLNGLIKIIANLFIYGFVFSVMGHFMLGDKFGLSRWFFISNTPFWFVKIYLMLYCIAPILNNVLKKTSVNNRLLLLLLLLWASGYMGLLGFDKSLALGKNLLHFVLLYTIGNTMVLYKERVNAISLKKIILAYVFVNIASVCIYRFAIGTYMENICYDMAFSYNSPLLMLNALLFFIPFMRIEFRSKTINWLAGSCFAIYLIHSSDLFIQHPIKYFAMELQTMTSSVYGTMGLVIVLAIIIFFSAIAIDKLLTPLWKLEVHISEKLNKTKVGTIAQEWTNQ